MNIHLTKSQIKTLKGLKIGEWVHCYDLPKGVSSVTIKALMDHKKVISVEIERATKITDQDVENGYINLSVKKFVGGHPYFVKKIEESTETTSETKIEEMLEEMEKLKLKIESLEQKNNEPKK